MFIKNFKMNKRIHMLTGTNYIGDVYYLTEDTKHLTTKRYRKINKINPEDYWTTIDDTYSSDDIEYLFKIPTGSLE